VGASLRKDDKRMRRPILMTTTQTERKDAEEMWKGMFRSTTVIMAAIKQQGTAAASSKDLWILRHGQATHNPRAEAARANGCSFDEFFDLMRQDDSLDSPLTEHGRQQATAVFERYGKLLSANVELVVSSPLSRAIETANLALPPSPAAAIATSANSGSTNDPQTATATRTTSPARVCYEGFREINGVLRNAQRQTVSQLQARFGGHWNWDYLTTDHDATWEAERLESTEAVAARGVAGLRWLLGERSERGVLLVAHGGLLRYTFDQCVVRDERRSHAAHHRRSATARFGNGELRRYRLEQHSCGGDEGDGESSSTIVLTEVDFSEEER